MIQNQTPTPAADLTSAQTAEAAGYEAEVDRWQSGYHAAGAALLLISGRHTGEPLFTGDWKTYVAERFGMEKSKAYRLMRAAEVCEVLEGVGAAPANENMADALSNLPAESAREVWAAVLASDGRPTIKKVKEERARRSGTAADAPPAETPASRLLGRLRRTTDQLRSEAETADGASLTADDKRELRERCGEVRNLLDELEGLAA